MKLSILICSVYKRVAQRADLLLLLRNSIGKNTYLKQVNQNYLLERYQGAEAEIILCTDHKKLTVGTKRNLLIDEACGDYIVFVDDDDMVTVNYVQAILDKITRQPDVIVFNALRYHNGQRDKPVIYGIEYSRDYSTPKFHYRLPNHLMCVRKSIAAQVRFADISFGEDADYARRLLPYLKHQERIFEMLYEYWYSDENTETNTNPTPKSPKGDFEKDKYKTT